MNAIMNTEAGEALEKAVEKKNEYITASFPHQRMVMECREINVTASTTEAIYK